MAEIVKARIVGDWRRVIGDEIVSHETADIGDAGIHGTVTLSPVWERGGPQGVIADPGAHYSIHPVECRVRYGRLYDPTNTHPYEDVVVEIDGQPLVWEAKFDLAYRRRTGEKEVPLTVKAVTFDSSAMVAGQIALTGILPAAAIPDAYRAYFTNAALSASIADEARDVAVDAADTATGAAVEAVDAADAAAAQVPLAAAEADRAIGLANAQDAHIAGTLEDPDSATHAAFKTVGNATYADKEIEGGLAFVKARNVREVTDDATVVDTIGDQLYVAVGSSLYRSSSIGGARTLVHAFTNTIHAVRDAGDGDLLVVVGNNIVKGRDSTWTQTLATQDRIGQFGFSTHDNLAFVTNYTFTTDMTKSRWAWLSTDHGATWTVVYDTADTHPELDQMYAHNHVAAIDPYAGVTPRLWLTYHKTDADPTNSTDPFARIVYSDDLGQTWHVLSANFIQPVIGVPTPGGMVFDTDKVPALYVARRTPDPADMKLELLHTFRRATAQFGWATKAIPASGGGAHIIFRSSVSGGYPGTMVTTDGYTAVETLLIDPETVNDSCNLKDVAALKGRMQLISYAPVSGLGPLTVVADEPTRGVPSSDDLPGLTGGFAENLGVAVGVSSYAGIRGAAVGVRANAAEQGSTLGMDAVSGYQGAAVGYRAKADGSGVAVGHLAEALAINGVVGGVAVGIAAKTVGLGTAIGYSADTYNTDGTAVGAHAQAREQAVAVGETANASGQWGTAVGRAAQATATGSVAIGRASKSSHEFAMALGAVVQTTSANQLAIGARHLEIIKAASGVANAPDNSARLYVQDNGSGKMQLVVRFPTGAAVVLGTEA